MWPHFSHFSSTYIANDTATTTTTTTAHHQPQRKPLHFSSILTPKGKRVLGEGEEREERVRTTGSSSFARLASSFLFCTNARFCRREEGKALGWE